MNCFMTNRSPRASFIQRVETAFSSFSEKTQSSDTARTLNQIHQIYGSFIRSMLMDKDKNLKVILIHFIVFISALYRETYQAMM